MTSTETQDALRKERNLGPPKSTSESTPGSLGHDNDKASSGATLPGWTMMMRPLKKKDRGTAEASATVTANAGGYGVAKDDKTNDVLKITQTHDSSFGGGGEVETLNELRSDDELLANDQEPHTAGDGGAFYTRNSTGNPHAPRPVGVVETGQYRTYKRRWFGLVQLVLLNIVVSWDWLTFSANSTTSSQYFRVSVNAINWLSTAFLFAFVAISPFTMWALNRGGPKLSIMISATFLLVGNWIRYGSTRAGAHYGATMFGQILIGFAQPFVLAAPTRYSDIWFTSRGRIAATAVMSLANPLGGALAQLINPFWAGDGQSDKVPSMVLYVSIIATVASIPSFFIPHSPPTPVAPSSEEEKHPLIPSFKLLFRSREFWLVVIPFMFYIGLFNSLSTLVNGMLAPYGFSETQAGIGGALLIVVGLVSAAIASPIIDRTKAQLLSIKICVPIIAFSYLAFTFAPATRSIAAIYVILSVLGAASFSLMPIALEYLIEITHPVSPEITSTICWTGGQLAGAIFILVSDALRDPGKSDGSRDDGSTRPPGNMYRALIFQTVMAMIVFPLPMTLGLFGRHKEVRMRRVEVDKKASAQGDAESVGVNTSA